MKNRTLRGLVILTAIIIVLVLISGCAAQAFKGQCAMKPVAHENGVSYVNVICMDTESQE